MDANEAIKKLQEIKNSKKELESNKNTNEFAKGLNTFKDIIIKAMVDLVKIMLTHEPRITVKNFPKTTKMEKELIKMNLTLDKIALTLESLSTGQMVRSMNLKKPATEPVK